MPGNAKGVIEMSPGRSTIGYAVLLVNSLHSETYGIENLPPEDFAFFEAFFDLEEAQKYAKELKGHFGRLVVLRVELFEISVDTDGKVEAVFPNLRGLATDGDEIIQSMGKFYFEYLMFPLLVMVDVEDHSVFDADAPTHDIYCYNNTEIEMEISAEAAYFTTVDEDSGEGITHGPEAASWDLDPGEYAKVGDIKGWEWDSALSMSLVYQINGRSFEIGYDLKRGGSKKATLPGKQKGYIVRPATSPTRLRDPR